MPANYRCKYKNIWDSTTRRYRCCKNKRHYGNFCIIHYKLLYTKHAIIIQKMYKGYYIRKKLKIYYNLPRDLQIKIIWHINSGLYLRNYNSSVSNIICRRYKEFYNKYTVDYNSVIYTNTEIFTRFYTDLISLLKLSNKYYLIINVLKIPYFNSIKKLCHSIIINNSYFQYNVSDTNLLIIKTYIKLFD